MKMPPVLRDAWQKRATANVDWFAGQYVAAIGRIQDYTDNDPKNRYYSDSAEEFDVMLGEDTISDPMGSRSAEEIRKHAFELLVLADLAELQR